MEKLAVWFRLLRGTQWSKNAVVFAALVFGDPRIDHPLLRTLAAFILFCCISSAIYILNDWRDMEQDRLHPTKSRRPMAAGMVSARAGLVVAAILATITVIGSLLVSPWLTLVLAVYALLMLAYIFRLKEVVLLDAFVIATGFVLRAVAGAAAVEVPVSAWLALCTMLLALFLAFGKRRSELVKLGADASAHRHVLAGYTLPLLDGLLIMTASCAIMGYSIYSFTSESVPTNGAMMLSVPFVVFAIMRYLYLLVSKGEGGAPETLLWRDMPLLIAVVLWGVTVLAVMTLGN